MMLPYFFRLLCLCLGCYFAIHLVVGMVAGLCVPVTLRLAMRLRPAAGARLVLALRLLPACVASIAVAALCAPSYLWLEPRTSSGEAMGFAVLGAALCGAAMLGVSAARAAAASFRSFRCIRSCRRAAQRRRIAGDTVWVLDHLSPQLMLAGVLRPQMVISRRVADALPPEQLEAALRHERAHRNSRDNFKRLLLLLAPGLFPRARALTYAWMHLAERSADDRAVAGDPERCLSLAAALVAVARMGSPEPPQPLATSLLAEPHDLSARVDRLLTAVPPVEPSHGALWTLGAAALTAGIALLLAQPATLYTVHRLLERLAS